MKPKSKKKSKNTSNQKYPNRFLLVLRDSVNKDGKGKYKDKPYTLKDVAKGANVSYPVVNDLKQQKRKGFNPRTLAAVATFLGVTVEELMTTYKSKLYANA
jgi:hypothetical protein